MIHHHLLEAAAKASADELHDRARRTRLGHAAGHPVRTPPAPHRVSRMRAALTVITRPARNVSGS